MSPAVEISVNIDVSDLEAAIEFYRLALGLHLGRRLFEGSVAEMLGGVVKDLSPHEAGRRFSVIRRSTAARLRPSLDARTSRLCSRRCFGCRRARGGVRREPGG